MSNQMCILIVMINIKIVIKRNKLLGLIGAKKPYSIFFQTRFGIHTFGLKFPIDVLILDKNNKVVKLRQNLKQNRIFVWNPKYNNVIELPVGTIEKKKIKIGNKISMY